jgi:hypothetical protein
VVAAYAQVRLTRVCVADRRLPWERPVPAGALTPYRVPRAFSALLLALGTPASPTKPCGRSLRRTRSHRSGPAPRYPALKKTAWRHRKPVPLDFLARSAPPAGRPWLNHKLSLPTQAAFAGEPR